MHLADTFIQSDLQWIQAIHFFISTCVPWELNPQPFVLLTQCSTTEPQKHVWCWKIWNTQRLQDKSLRMCLIPAPTDILLFNIKTHTKAAAKCLPKIIIRSLKIRSVFDVRAAVKPPDTELSGVNSVLDGWIDCLSHARGSKRAILRDKSFISTFYNG